MILVIQGWLPHYRLELFNALAKYDDVCVVHSGKSAKRENDRFEETILPSHQLGPFQLQPGLIDLIDKRKPRAVIAMFDLRWLSIVKAMYKFDCRLKWVWWGLSRGKSDIATRAKLFVARRDNPIVFYDKVTKNSFKSKLLTNAPLLVANNTVHVPNRTECFHNPIKNRIINVGSLDARKQNDVTIRVLKKIYDETGADIQFSLIGSGSEREKLVSLVHELGMQERVEFVGHIEDTAELARYYSEAIASVSFGQAGLAVLQSMAFGVPFVTKKTAISGGEKYNITNGETGIFVQDSPDALEAALKHLFADTEYARRLGKSAYHYYSKEATIENMVSNFASAIDNTGRRNG